VNCDNEQRTLPYYPRDLASQCGPVVKVRPHSVNRTHTLTRIYSHIHWRLDDTVAMTNKDGNNMAQPCGSRNRLGPHTCTLNLAPQLNDENNGDMSGLTRKFLLAFSYCAFYSILNPFSFPLSFMYLGGHSVPWHYGFICCHRLLQSHLDIPRKCQLHWTAV